jgi:hypothetical protein
MHQFLRSGVGLLAAPVLTTALVAVGMVGLLRGPAAADPAPAGPGTEAAAVTAPDGWR